MLHLVIIFGEARNDQLGNYPYHYLCHVHHQAAKGIDNTDRARKQCLWRGNSEKKKGGNLVAWPTVMMSKDKGGLGIINLRLQNDAMLMKHLSKFYNRADVPWVRLIWSKYYTNRVPHATREMGSFWWKDVLRLNVLFRGIATCVT